MKRPLNIPRRIWEVNNELDLGSGVAKRGLSH